MAPTPSSPITKFLLLWLLGVIELSICAPPRRVAVPQGASHMTRRYKATMVK